MAVNAPGVAWAGLGAVLALGAASVACLAAAHRIPPFLIDWQPALDCAEPWRPWTAAWVHWSGPHLAANLLAAAVLGALGWRARMPVHTALAWAIAWPLTHGLLDAVDPLRLALYFRHYGGLSGVLHAGAVVLGLALWRGDARPRGVAPARAQAVGLALLAGVALKVGLEAPWDLRLRLHSLLGIAVAPLVHLTGALAGALAWSAVAAVRIVSFRKNPWH